MIVISNTSPISGLAEIGQLDLVRELFGTIIIPDAVRNELTAKGGQHAGSKAVDLEWISTRSVSNQVMVDVLRGDLDVGEAEVLALAIELSADLVILDERRGRKVAARLGITSIGCVGILLHAKEDGLISEVLPCVKQLRDTGFWMSAGLEESIRKAANE